MDIDEFINKLKKRLPSGKTLVCGQILPGSGRAFVGDDASGYIIFRGGTWIRYISRYYIDMYLRNDKGDDLMDNILEGL
jgi:hypothetical protein